MACESCGDKPKKCDKDFTKAVIEIDNPEQITLMRKVTIPASMGDDTTVPPVVGKYKNVLLFYEANSKSYLYSSDGIPTLLANGLTDYEQAVNLPQINGVTLIGNRTSGQLGLQPTLSVAPDTGIKLENNELSGLPATDTTIGMVKPGDGLEVDVSGTMSISDIEQYAHFFDTVADMKAADLADGDYARTLGYYIKDDMGGAYYKISSITPSGYYEILNSGLYAELAPQDTMNIRQFGAKGDGITDDTSKLQLALNSYNNLYVPKGNYKVNAVTNILVPSNSRLTLDEEATIEALPNDSGTYAILKLDNVDNVEISGGCIKGERTEHTGDSGEWGMCISVIGGSSNINIHDIRLIDAWGDGLYISNAINVSTSNLIIDNCRRNGISVISANNYHSLNDTVTNISGVDPQFGVDIEPNENTDILKNINFENLSTASCNKGGFCVSLQNLDTTSAPIDIKMNNYSDNSSPVGIRLIKDAGVEGEFVINDASLISNINNGVQFRNWQYNEKFYTKIVGLNIRRTSVESNVNTNSAIYMLGTTKSGNIILENLNIEQTGVGNNAYDIYLASQNDNVAIINPIHKTGVYHVGNYSTNFHISDVNEVLKLESSTASGTIGTYDIRSLSVRNGNSPTDTTVTFSANTPVGYKCVFTNINIGTGLYQIQLPADTYCRQFSSSAAPLIKLATGATLTLQRLTSTEFIVLSASGAITV